MLERAVEIGLPDELLFRTLLETALLRKKLGQWETAVQGFKELSRARNPCRMRAWEELAKYYEHRERNYPAALEMTLAALAWQDTPELRARETRIRSRLQSLDRQIALPRERAELATNPRPLRPRNVAVLAAGNGD